MCVCFVCVLFLCVRGDFFCVFVCVHISMCVYDGGVSVCVFLTASPSVCVDPSVLSFVFEYICLPLWSLCLAVCVFVIVCVSVCLSVGLSSVLVFRLRVCVCLSDSFGLCV